MTTYLSLIMFICIVPTLIMCYIIMYPKNWKSKKLIFGVKNREEYRVGDAEEIVDKIVRKYRKQAGVVMCGGTAISVILLLIRKMTLSMTIWTVFIMLAILAINVPYMLGNKELKAFKRSLGLGEQAGVSYADLSNAGAVHGLNKTRLLIPNIVAIVFCIMTVLADLKVLPVPENWIVGTFALTGLYVSMWAMGILMSVLAVMMDRMKNEVISKDSTINANYNRAKKKNFADMFVTFVWINTIFAIGMSGGMAFLQSNLFMMILFGAYMLFLMLGIANFVKKGRMIESRYEKEIQVLTDDDDCWIAGSIYYNPKDHRLNVEKRNGVGGTVNVAHPVGKGIFAVAGLLLIAAVLSIVWMCMMEATPMKLLVEQDKLICHHLKDEYVINLNEIQNVEWGEKIDDLDLHRMAGVGTDTMRKGNFVVDQQKGCKVFIWTESVHYIKVETSDETYYISSGTPEEMESTYQALLDNMK